jgi:glycosyltransferase involved in cell wall biosynthesis
MLRRARALNPDVIHVSTPGPVGGIGRWVAGRLRVPLVGTYHTDFPAYLEHLFADGVLTRCTQGVMKWFYSPFRAIFARSEEYLESLRGWGLPRARLVRLHAGLDTSAFSPSFRDTGIWERLDPGCNQCGEVVRVLFCGRVSVEKNLALLARLWGRVVQKAMSQAMLVVVGDGPYRREMEAVLAGLPALFLGFRHGHELSALYASSDLFVFPSLTDTLGQAVMESQASGTPVIVSDQGGPKEIVRQGETGVVVPGHDERAWVDAIVGLIDEGAKRHRMGEAAHRFMQNFAFKKSFEHFWSVHEEVVEASRQRE